MQCNPNYVLREIYGIYILMPTHRNNIGNEPIHLNDVAALIWKNAAKCKTSEDLLTSITEIYGLIPDSIEQNAVGEFIQQLIQMDLISD